MEGYCKFCGERIISYLIPETESLQEFQTLHISHMAEKHPDKIAEVKQLLSISANYLLAYYALTSSLERMDPQLNKCTSDLLQILKKLIYKYHPEENLA